MDEVKEIEEVEEKCVAARSKRRIQIAGRPDVHEERIPASPATTADNSIGRRDASVTS